MLKVLIFDLDYTLYPRGTGPLILVGKMIERYMVEQLGMPPDRAKELRAEYRRRYGISTTGLFLHHDVDSEDFTQFVHDVDIEAAVAPNPALAKVLEGIAIRKIIFTNGSAEYARRILKALGVAQYFDEIYDLRFMHYRCKPDPEPYRWLLEKLGLEPRECLFIEDNARNLGPAKELGMATVLVGQDPDATQDNLADYTISDILEIGEVVQKAARDKATT